MADNSSKRKVNSSLDMLRKQVNDLYTTTYFTRDTSEEIKTQVSDRLDDAIRKSTQGDEEFNNISNTSKLFRKLLKPDGSSATSKLSQNFGKGGDDDISNLFQSPDMIASIMDSYTKTKWIADLDNEFDLICRYMPKLQAALDIKRDAVLCSDSYSKDFMNVRAKGENPSDTKNEAIQNNINEMIKKLKKVSHGDLTVEVRTKRKDEFKLLADGITDMTAHMKKLVTGLKDVNGELSKAAMKVARAKGLLDNPTPISVEQAEASLIEEYNDLLNCVTILDKVSGLSLKDDFALRPSKYLRWAERIKNYKTKLEE